MTQDAPKYKFYVFVGGRKAGQDPSVEVPFMMLDGGIDFNTSYAVAIKQDDQSITEFKSADDVEAFKVAAEMAHAYSEGDKTPIYQYWYHSYQPQDPAVPLSSVDELLRVNFNAKDMVQVHKDGLVIDEIYDREHMIQHLTDRGLLQTLEQAETHVDQMPDEPNAPNKVAAAVDAAHYKNYVDELQWIDAMSKIPSLRDPERFIAALELQIRKYMDRNGRKDESLQEWKKARFYMCYLVAYLENGCVCIPAAEIHNRMKGL